MNLFHGFSQYLHQECQKAVVLLLVSKKKVDFKALNTLCGI